MVLFILIAMLFEGGIGLASLLVAKNLIYSCSYYKDFKSLKGLFDHLCCCQNKCVLSWC